MTSKIIFLMFLFSGVTLADLTLEIAYDSNLITIDDDSVFTLQLEGDIESGSYWYIKPIISEDKRGRYKWLLDGLESGSSSQGLNTRCADTSIHTIVCYFSEDYDSIYTDSAKIKVKIDYNNLFTEKVFSGWYETDKGDSLYIKIQVNESTNHLLSLNVTDEPGILTVTSSVDTSKEGYEEYKCQILIDSVKSGVADCEFAETSINDQTSYSSSDKKTIHTGFIYHPSRWVGLGSRSQGDEIYSEPDTIGLRISPTVGEPYVDSIILEKVVIISSPITDTHSKQSQISILSRASEIRYLNLKGQLIPQAQIKNLPNGLIIKQYIGLNGEIIKSQIFKNFR